MVVVQPLTVVVAIAIVVAVGINWIPGSVSCALGQTTVCPVTLDVRVVAHNNNTIILMMSIALPLSFFDFGKFNS
ncbi:MAG: hypothetical protein ABSD99_06295 [Candidatus Bathyarchaeia archaeon]|jgi:hypothetical protein